MTTILIALGIVGAVTGIVVWQVRGKPKPALRTGAGVRVFARGPALDYLLTHREQLEDAIDRALDWCCRHWPEHEGRFQLVMAEASLTFGGHVEGERGHTQTTAMAVWFPAPGELPTYMEGYEPPWERVLWAVVSHECGHLLTGPSDEWMRREGFPWA